MEVWSFFSGALGLDLGLHEAGIRTTLAVEVDKWCCQTIRHNWPDVDLVEGDVREVTGASLRAHRALKSQARDRAIPDSGDVFLMVGGPPCQSFSPGGKRAGLSDPRGNLIYEYLRLIGEVQPQYFVLENVANLLTVALRHRKIKDRPGKHWNLKKYDSKNFQSQASEAPPLAADELSGSAIRQLLVDVDDLGYSVIFGVLDAADYGTAQHRRRFVMLGARDGKAPQLPTATHGLFDKPIRTLRDVIYDLRDSPGPHSSYTPNMAHYFSYVPPGGNWRDLPKSLQPEAMGGSYHSGGGKTGFFRRLSWARPAPTITGRANRKGSALCHPEFTRPLSVRECARIQGFPDDWYFSGSMSRQYLQIGNAVPVALGRAIGTSICHAALGQYKGTEESITMMLAKAQRRLRASARNKRASFSANVAKSRQLSLF